jgi:hypothetical protein
MGSLGDNDEDEASKQEDARDPKVRNGAPVGKRGSKDAKPLLDIKDLSAGLRSDQIVGAEVRSSDDKMVGEVRNLVFATKDGRDYAIVASGGFFTTGKESYVVPLRALRVSQDRTSFYLKIASDRVRRVPLMPDQEYRWLGDTQWRRANDLMFQ